NADGTSTSMIPSAVTTEKKTQKKNDVKARKAKRTATSSTSLSSQNMAFVSSPSSINNEVNTAKVQVSTANSSVITNSTLDSTANLSDATKITINGSDTAGYDKSKVECFNCHKMGYFARECRGPRNQESRPRNQDSSRRTMNVEDTSSKAMVAIDGAGFDWSFMAEEEVTTNMALMAFSDSEVYNDKTCSNTCLKSFEALKTQLDNLRVEFNKSEFNLATYKRSLASVEVQLVFYKKNEVMFCDQIDVLKRDASFKDSKIIALKSKIEKLKKEKECNQIKIDKFENASKCLDRLIGSQISDNSRKGVGYNVVPPPHTGLFAPQLLICQTLLVPEKGKQTVFPTKMEFVKQQDKTARKPVKYAEMYRSQKPRGNQRNWNNLKSQQLVSAARPINTVAPKSFVNAAKTRPNAFQKSHSPSRRPFYQQTALKKQKLNDKVNTAKINSINTAKKTGDQMLWGTSGLMLLSPQHAGQTQVSLELKVNDGEQQLTITVDGQTITNTEAFIRRHLQLADADVAAKILADASREKVKTYTRRRSTVNSRDSTVGGHFSTAEEVQGKNLNNIDWNTVAEQVQERQSDTIKRYQTLKKKPVSVAQARKNMMIYLKNMAGYKMGYFKGMSYDEIRPIFEKEYNKIQTLFKKDTEVEKTKTKRIAEETLLQESFKKLRTTEASRSEPIQEQPTEEPKELSEEELKKMMEIVPVEEIKAEALQIIRVRNITEAYQVFEDMLKGFDREDLVTLWSLVKERFRSAEPTEDKERALWVELKRLFEPDKDDVLWKLQKYYYIL
ncbi:ribonuclease H-like domain-containing protein, partial [Tanacetum coccineum]